MHVEAEIRLLCQRKDVSERMDTAIAMGFVSSTYYEHLTVTYPEGMQVSPEAVVATADKLCGTLFCGQWVRGAAVLQFKRVMRAAELFAPQTGE